MSIPLTGQDHGKCLQTLCWAVVWLLAAWPGSARSEPVAGAWLVVPNPLLAENAKGLINEANHALAGEPKGVKHLVFHFKDRIQGEYTACLQLANDLRNQLHGRADVKLYAFVEGDVRGHPVLPLLTFERIYLGVDSGFGSVGEMHAGVIPRDQKLAYEEAAHAGGKPIAAVLKMLYPELTLYRAQGGLKVHGTFDKFAIGPEQRQQVAISEDERRQAPVIKPSGQAGFFPEKEAVECNLAIEAGVSARELADRLKLGDAAFLRNPVAGTTKLKAGWIEVRGSSGVIDGGTAESVARKIERALGRENCNYLIFVLEVGGGPDSLAPALDAAKEIQKVRERAMTIAYIPKQATGAAVFVAFSCHEIVMGPDAAIHCEELVFRSRGKPFAEKDTEVARKALDEILAHRPKGLARAFLDPRPDLVYAELRPGQKGPRAKRFLTLEEFAEKDEDQNPRWQKIADVKAANTVLVLDTGRAIEWGIAHRVAREPSKAVLGEIYGIDPANIVTIDDSFLDKLASFLRHPLATVFLVIMGFTCLLLELKTPGVGLPAILAAVCFLLVFWAHSTLAGEVLSLAVLMFLLGVVLLGVELFVLPGFGVAGLSGIVLILLSLTLVMVRNWPSSTEQWIDMLTYLGIFGAGLLGALVAAYTIARYLPQIPYANRLVLQPPEEEAGEAVAVGAAWAQAPSLLGAVGTALTELRPGGRARFGDQYFDVAAEGAYVPAGARVQIIEIDGTRILVKEIQ